MHKKSIVPTITGWFFHATSPYEIQIVMSKFFRKTTQSVKKILKRRFCYKPLFHDFVQQNLEFIIMSKIFTFIENIYYYFKLILIVWGPCGVSRTSILKESAFWYTYICLLWSIHTLNLFNFLFFTIFALCVQHYT